MGMPHKDIPQLLGRVLSGTKYGVQQTRGKFGLGAKMALIWSKMSTGLPIDVRSAQQGQGFISHYSLDIDIHKYARPPARPSMGGLGACWLSLSLCSLENDAQQAACLSGPACVCRPGACPCSLLECVAERASWAC